ncbi:hypothetical protein CAOG_06037 [Capsaspora owczarzaki ATCC 30864]|uniref:Centromere protein S n=1 Tax=Capsaspora owczarzaki (strain ATCC 30864) TaxID=595528 RepID=A0A0D2UKN4_CAPO3|nr:hypothetical protein CAOG_06037 [Capsaspora owczarzaki ATCC 30864]KJE95601.1 hypothetical protein CAOG_006037 [Capsaspora owczarzaki ATCC 30864]|eukprot:XP_004345627.1 hypothetical protein CAOG_06037 [Capsaspora owczarzaki ATCC 30864]
MDDDDVSYDESLKARIKASVHYTVGKICQREESEMGVKCSKQFLAALAELTYGKCGSLASDLESFAKHAKRSTIQVEDVKLCARKNPSLAKLVAEKATDLEAETQERLSKKRRKDNKPADEDGESASDAAPSAAVASAATGATHKSKKVRQA